MASTAPVAAPLRNTVTLVATSLFLTTVDAAREFAQALLDRLTQLGVVFDLDRVVVGDLGQLIGSRAGCCAAAVSYSARN